MQGFALDDYLVAVINANADAGACGVKAEEDGSPVATELDVTIEGRVGRVPRGGIDDQI